MASVRITIGELRTILEEAIKGMLSSVFPPRITIRKIKKSDSGLAVEGDYYLFGEKGSFKAILGENKDILDLELIPKE